MKDEETSGPDDFEDEDYDDQLEQVVAENGVLLHALVEALLKKGLVQREEIEEQIDRLTSELEDDRE